MKEVVMTIRYFVLATALSITGTAVLAGWSGSDASAPVAYVPATILVRPQPQSHSIASDACDTTVRAKVQQNGGSFSVPPCSGWTGVINYPALRAPCCDGTTFLVTSSVTNNFGVPPPRSGTAIFYLKTKNKAAAYFANSGVTDTITSPQLTSNHTYTLIVYRLVIDDQCNSPPSCPPWSANIGSPATGSNSITFSSPLNGAAFPGSNRKQPVWQFVQN
jgi:hypothetical protein